MLAELALNQRERSILAGAHSTSGVTRWLSSDRRRRPRIETITDDTGHAEQLLRGQRLHRQAVVEQESAQPSHND